MDNKKFLEWLTLLTYWQYPRIDEKEIKPNIKTNRSAIKRRLAKRIEQIQQAHVDIDSDEEIVEEEIIYKDGINTSRNPIVLAVKYPDKPCEACGLIGQDRRIECKIYHTGGAHWRQRCSQCNKVLNPDTGCFDLDPGYAHIYFRDKITRRNK